MALKCMKNFFIFYCHTRKIFTIYIRTLITILNQLLTLLTVLNLLTLHYNTCLMPIYLPMYEKSEETWNMAV